MTTQTKPNHRFAVGQIDDGTWLAYSDHNPYFCFAGPTDFHVKATADEALKFYFQHEGPSQIEPLAKNRQRQSLQKLRNVRVVDGDGDDCDVS